MVAREVGSDTDFVEILTVYKGYSIEFVMTPNPDGGVKELTDEQIQMCIDFLTDMDFVPADEAGVPDDMKDAKWLASLIDYDAETGTVTVAASRTVTIPAAEAEALKVGDTLKVGNYEEAIGKLETFEDATIIINDGATLIKYGDEYHFYPDGEYEYTEPYADLKLEIPDSLVFYDGINPETGEALETDTEHTADELKAMLAEDTLPGFNTDNVYVTFDAEGNWTTVERFYTPAQ
jgi:hypothetical protein